jgi:hypothetical protein
VVGTGDIVDCMGPLSLDELRAHHERPRIPLNELHCGLLSGRKAQVTLWR